MVGLIKGYLIVSLILFLLQVQVDNPSEMALCEKWQEWVSFIWKEQQW